MDGIKKNQATAKYRRVSLLIYADTDHVTPWAGSVTGVKAQLSFNGAAEAASTNDIVRVGGAVHYVELTQAESNTDDGELTVRVAAASGRDEGLGKTTILNYDPIAAGADYSSNLTAIESDTQDIQSRIPAALVSGRIDASVGAIAAAAITDTAFATEAELAALPSTGAQTLPKMVRYLFQRARHKRTTTATQDKMFKADGSTVLATAALSDDATTFTKGADA